jgi:transcriptional regulator with XRE-family HTH domain
VTPDIVVGTASTERALDTMARTRVHAERLRFELARRGWDGCDLATAAGLSAATVSAAIQGRHVSTATLRKMVFALSRAPVLPGIDELVSQ